MPCNSISPIARHHHNGSQSTLRNNRRIRYVRTIKNKPQNKYNGNSHLFLIFLYDCAHGIHDDAHEMSNPLPNR